MKHVAPHNWRLSRITGFCLVAVLNFVVGGNVIAAPDPMVAMQNALQRGDCPFAISQARQILSHYPSGTVEAAQANLTIGSCLLRAKRWSAAQRALRLARPLSGRAAQTRRRLEKFAAEREREESRSFGSGTTNSVWNPVAAQPYWQAPAPVVMPVGPAYGKAPQTRPGPRPAAAKVARGPGSASTVNSFSITPATTYNRVDSYKSYSGLMETSGYSMTTETKVTAQARSESPLAYAGGDALALSLPVELNYVQSSGSDETTSFSRASDLATTISGTVTEKGRGSKEFLTTATPGVTVPLGKDIEFEGSFLYSLTLPNFKPVGKSSQRAPKVSLDLEAGLWKASGSVSYDERLNSSDARTQSSSILSGNLSYAAGVQTWTLAATRTDTDVPVELRNDSISAANTSASLTAKIGGESADYKLTGSYSAYERFPGLVFKAPAATMKISGDVDVPFGVFSLGGNFSYGSLSDYVRSYTIKDETGGEVSYLIAANGTQTQFGGKFKVTAFKWLAFAIAYSNTTTDYTTNNPLVHKLFLKDNESAAARTTVSAALSREF